MYRRLTSHWPDPGRVVVGAIEPPTRMTDEASHARLADVAERMLYLDLVTYLPDDILTKVDRASMAVALEARVPLLDHRVVEFAWRLPHTMKIRDGRSKWILREVLRRYVPDHLIERPKMGFGVPIASWLRGPLREWAENLLDSRRLNAEGFLVADAVRAAWSDHLSGNRNREWQLWAVLMFQAWLGDTTRSGTASCAQAVAVS
jgi:asparagine synthase (glutamine-hydrolysing)